MNAITVKNLIKDYKEHRAVDGISFEVGEGELFAFLGENGAGKSTTINILSTILQKTSKKKSSQKKEALLQRALRSIRCICIMIW